MSDAKYANVFSLWNELSGIRDPIYSWILPFFPFGYSDSWTSQIALVCVLMVNGI